MSKFSLIRTFKRRLMSPNPLADIEKYLAEDLAKTIEELRRGLKSLSLEDNFDGWVETDLVLGASSETKIKNRIAPAIPTKRIILRSTSDSVTDGSSEWTSEWVYLRNNGASSATVTVAFLK